MITIPIPEPKKGEEQDDYIARCMRWMHENEQDMPREQQLAVCFDTFRRARGIERPRHLEAFRWVPQIKATLPPNGRLYAIKCIRAGYTYHLDDKSGNTYRRVFTAEELKRSARTLIDKPVNLDHHEKLQKTHIVDAEFEDDYVEAIIYSEDDILHSLFDRGHIIGASVEYFWRDEKAVNGLKQIGVVFSGLAIVTDRYANPPASPYTDVKRLLTRTHSHNVTKTQKKRVSAMTDDDKTISQRLTAIETAVKALETRLEKSQRQAQAEDYRQFMEQCMQEGNTMQECAARWRQQHPEQPATEERTEALIQLLHDKIVNLETAVCDLTTAITKEEQFAELPDRDFACIIGEGEDRQRKLPIHDEAHVRNAMARFNQTIGCQTPEVRAKICARARRFNIEGAFEEGGFCERYAEELTRINEKKVEAVKEPKTDIELFRNLCLQDEKRQKKETQKGIVASGKTEKDIPPALKEAWEKREKQTEKYRIL